MKYAQQHMALCNARNAALTVYPLAIELHFAKQLDDVLSLIQIASSHLHVHVQRSD